MFCIETAKAFSLPGNPSTLVYKKNPSAFIQFQRKPLSGELNKRGFRKKIAKIAASRYILKIFVII